MTQKSKFAKGLASVLSLSLALTAFAVPAYADEAKDEVKITILGTSDVHGRYMPWDYAVDGESTNGSLSQISTLVKEVKAEEENTVLVEMGDLIQDNSSELFQDMSNHPAVSVLNALGYDAWTVGNHEFDYGIEKLDNILAQFNGVAMGGNLYTDAGEQYYPGYTIVERDGVKIGLVGLTTEMVYEFKEDTDIFDGFKFTNATEEAKKIVKELEGQVDALVGVFHMGMENENNRPDTGVRDIANACPEFDVIFAGHMHKLENSEVNGVLIIEPDKYVTNVSRVDLTFTKDGDKFALAERAGENIPVKTYASDAEAEALLAEGHKIARDDANVVVGKLTGMDFAPANTINAIPIHQVQETPMTNFFNEVMSYYSNGADVTAHQIDNDNAKLAIGDIKKKDIANCYQYAGGEVTVYKITGQDLKDYMEWSAAYFNQAKDGDVTVSFDATRRNSKYSTHDIFGGVKYEFNLANEAGNRVENLTWLDGREVSMTEELTIGMNAYRMKALIAEGGALAGRNFEQVYSTADEATYGEIEGRIRNLSARYLAEVKNGVYEGHLNNTWKITGVDETPDYVVALVNDGVLNVGAAENGRSNVTSINLKNAPTQDEIAALAASVGAEATAFADAKTNADLYQAVYAYKNGEVAAPAVTEEPAEVVEEVVKPIETTPVATEEPVANEGVYIVVKGDNLWKISKNHGVSLESVIKANKFTNPNLIYPGDKVNIPVK